MMKFFEPINIYLQISLEIQEDGKRQARIARTPGPISEFDFSGVQAFGVHQRGEIFNGWQPAINHTYILNAYLYWQPNVFSPKMRRDVTHKLSKYVYRLLEADETLKQIIYQFLPGTGWYLRNDKFK